MMTFWDFADKHADAMAMMVIAPTLFYFLFRVVRLMESGK